MAKDAKKKDEAAPVVPGAGETVVEEGAAAAAPDAGPHPTPEEKPKVIHVTRTQWVAIVLLALGLVGVYLVWPRLASDQRVMKPAGHYVQKAREAFDLALGERSFPKEERKLAYLDVAWNYETAQKTGAWTPSCDDAYRWGYALYQLAELRGGGSPRSYVHAVRQLSQALHGWQKAPKGTEDWPQEVSEEKARFLLARAYLFLDNAGEAARHLEILRVQKWEYERRVRQGAIGPLRTPSAHAGALPGHGSPAGEAAADPEQRPPVRVGQEPYHLQVRELMEVDLLLGRAYYRGGRVTEAIEALKDYWAGTSRTNLQRRMGGESIDSDNASRFETLDLLSRIYWEQARAKALEIRKARASRLPDPLVEMMTREWRELLLQSAERLDELFKPEYGPYNRAEARLRLAEVRLRLGEPARVHELAADYQNESYSKREEMVLWNLLALRAEGRLDETLVQPAASIAGGGYDVDRAVRLGALLFLGEVQTAMGREDMPLAGIVSAHERRLVSATTDAYIKAVADFSEKEFDENPFLDKLSLVDNVLARARKARDAGELESAQALYAFLLERLSTPQARLLREIAVLERQRAELLVAEDKGLSERARTAFRNAAGFHLRTLELPFDAEVRPDVHFEAAECYFDGGYHTKAWEHYGMFLRMRPEDERLGKARHKRGLAALHRRVETRFDDAITEFVANIGMNVRPVGSNLALPEPRYYSKPLRPGDPPMDESKTVDSILSDVDHGARDIWAQHSFLALGDAFYAQHKYVLARRIYTALMRDRRFTPEAELWRRAAYQLARLAWDEASESAKRPKPWHEVVPCLEEVLLRYDLAAMSAARAEDKGLLEEIRRDNAEMKLLLARAYLEGGSVEEAARQCRDLLAEGDPYRLEHGARRKTEALLGDALMRLGRHDEALERFRLAHDKHLDAYERPFYGLRMAGCLEAMGKTERAASLLKRTRWEFEKPQVFADDAKDPDPLLAQGGGARLDRKFWLDFVDAKIARLEGRPAAAPAPASTAATTATP